MKAGLRALVVIVLAGGLATIAYALHRVGDARGYAPVQPIAFSHALHAGRFEVPCLYCHFGAETSRHAGIPPTSTCMNCHALIALRTRDIARLEASWAQRRPIPWVRVHDLPDFVSFDHARHVRLAGLACETCHGAVASMERVRQAAPLTMGWCIACHRELGVVPPNQRANDGAHTKQRPGGIAIGGLDCARCHH